MTGWRFNRSLGALTQSISSARKAVYRNDNAIPLLHSGRPKLHPILAFLNAVGLKQPSLIWWCRQMKSRWSNCECVGMYLLDASLTSRHSTRGPLSFRWSRDHVHTIWTAPPEKEHQTMLDKLMSD